MLVPAPEGVYDALRWAWGREPEVPGAWEDRSFGGPDEETAEWMEAARRIGLLAPLPATDYGWLLERDPLEELSEGIRGLTLGVTERCNFRCAYCTYSGYYEGHRVHSAVSMPWDVARRCLDFFFERADPGGHVAFYGGEPTMEWDVLEASVSHARACGPSGLVLRVTTNASLLDARRVRFLVDHDVGLTVSLDGPARMHDSARRFAGGDPTHAAVMARLAMARDLAPSWYESHVGFNCLLRARTLEELREVDAFFATEPVLRGMPVHVLGLQGGMDSSHAESEGFDGPGWSSMDLGELFLEVLQADRARDRRGVVGSMLESTLGSVLFREVGLEPDQGWPGAICYPGKERLYVGVDGRFYFCHNLDVADGCIGDLERGFDPQRIRAILRDFLGHFQEECPGCWARRLCTVCQVKAKRGGRLDTESLREVCRSERSRLERRLETFASVWVGEEARGLTDHPASLHRQVQREKGRPD